VIGPAKVFIGIEVGDVAGVVVGEVTDASMVISLANAIPLNAISMNMIHEGSNEQSPT
jgi:hypothetical protein